MKCDIYFPPGTHDLGVCDYNKLLYRAVDGVPYYQHPSTNHWMPSWPSHGCPGETVVRFLRKAAERIVCVSRPTEIPILRDKLQRLLDAQTIQAMREVLS
jgi:hypothetical protein